MRPYSQDLRDRVVNTYQEGGITTRGLAERFCVSQRWVQKILRQVRQTGSSAAQPHGGGRPPTLTAEHQQTLAQHLARQPDATLEELRQHLGVRVSRVSIWRKIQRLGLSRKKKA